MIASIYRKLFDKICSSEGVFYRYYEEERTYQDLKGQMLRFQSALNSLDPKRIGIYSGKNLSNYAAILTILFSGRTWIPLNPNLPHLRVLEMLGTSAPDLILTDRPVPTAIEDWAKEANIEILSLCSLGTCSPTNTFSIGPIEPNDPAIILFTSGSTGSPKGVLLNHSNCISIARTSWEVLPYSIGETIADYHDVGFVKFLAVLFPCLWHGSSISPGIRNEDILIPDKHLLENRVSSIVSVPSTVARLQRRFPNGVEGLDLNLVVLCGEPLHLDVLDYVTNILNPRNIVQFYGATEAGCVFHYLYNAEDVERFRKIGLVPIGHPVPGVEARLDVDGELMVSGPPVSVGYINDSASPKFTHHSGRRWYRTGDIAEIYEDLYFCKGRRDHMVKIAGNRIELLEIEARLRQLEAISEAVCFINEPEGRPTEIIAAVLTDEFVDIGAIRMQLREWLPRYMIPKKFLRYTEFPTNKNGKVDRLAISAHYRDSKSTQYD